MSYFNDNLVKNCFACIFIPGVTYVYFWKCKPWVSSWTHVFKIKLISVFLFYFKSKEFVYEMWFQQWILVSAIYFTLWATSTYLCTISCCLKLLKWNFLCASGSSTSQWNSFCFFLMRWSQFLFSFPGLLYR